MGKRKKERGLVRDEESVRSLGVAFQLLALAACYFSCAGVLASSPCSHAIVTPSVWWHSNSVAFTTDNWESPNFYFPPHLCCALQRSHFSLLGVTGKKKKKMLTGVTVSFQSQLRPHRSVPPTQIPMCYSLHRLWLESSKRTIETKLISRHLSVMIPRPFGNMTAKLSHQQQRQNKAGMKTKNLISL